ncbi:hypothetical protein E4U41_006401 [Claviceps citrina]|nr:hypothetical protein E4U41_006401 [Claviceps citrina]
MSPSRVMRRRNTARLLLAALRAASIAHAAVTNRNGNVDGNNDNLPIQLQVRSELTTRLANVHLSTSREVQGPVSFTHGSCTAQSKPDHDHHHVVSSAASGAGEGGSRLVWIIPEDAPVNGCISAWDQHGALVGRSEPLDLTRVLLKRATKPIAMTEANGFDPIGPWFDGVKFLKQKPPSAVDVGAAKKKKIAIVGAGLSGLTTYLLLHQAGFTNVQVLEASNRLGGRVHTQYLTGGPQDYSYQELGAMRLPVDYVDPDSKKKYNISDTQLVFELIAEMNRLNADRSHLRLELIDWVEESDRNGLRYFDGVRTPAGLPPTVGEVDDGPTLAYDAETSATDKKLQDSLPDNAFMLQMAPSPAPIPNMPDSRRNTDDTAC